MQIISDILGGIIDLLVWLFQSVLNVIAWIIAKIFDLLKIVVDIYTGMIGAYPGVTALVFFIFIASYFLWWGIYHKLRYTPQAFWQKPGVALTVLFPFVCAILGLILQL